MGHKCSALAEGIGKRHLTSVRPTTLSRVMEEGICAILEFNYGGSAVWCLSNVSLPPYYHPAKVSTMVKSAILVTLVASAAAFAPASNGMFETSGLGSGNEVC
jgi:hypothetical protein